MIQALATHIWLLLTLRHDGKGLKTEFFGTIAIFLVYIILSLINLQIRGSEFLLNILILFVLFGIIYKSSGSAKTNAFYLIAIGANLFAILSSLFIEPKSLDILFFIWQIVAVVKIFSILKD